MADLSSYINIKANVVTTGNLTATGNVTSNSILSTTGNVTGNYFIGNGSQLTGITTNYGNANVANYLPTFSGSLTAGNISVTGNIQGNYILGNGSQLTGLPASYGNSSVATFLAAYGSNTISTSGNITAGNVLNNGLSSVTGNITGGNIATAGQVSATGNITTANSFVGNLVGTTASMTGNVYAGIVSASGNVRGGNINTAGSVTATGNIYAGNVIINGQATTYGVVTPAYMVVGLVTSVSGFNNGSTFILDTIVGNTNSQVSYNSSTGVFTLTAGVTYDMSFTPSFITFSNTTTGFFCYDWVDATTNVQLDTTGIGTGTSISSQDTTAQQDNATARVIYTPSTNQTVKLRVTNASGTVTLRGGIGTQAIIKPLNPTIAVQATSFGNVSASGYVSATGNVTANTFVGSGSGLTGVAKQTTGSWSVTAGTNTYSFTVPSGTWQMWVTGNIPNGIIAWNAIATVTNTNVPVVGQQYAWVYNGGGSPIDFVSIPSQFTGTANAIVRSNVAPSATTNRFDFSINNTSGNTQTVQYGYTAL